MKRNYKTLIIVTIGILLCIGVSAGSYALWINSQKQQSQNKIIGACLNVILKDADAAKKGMTFDNAWPVSDFEGMQLEGYKFTVTNSCDEPIDYRIDLNSLEIDQANYMSNSSVAVLLDYGVKTIYEELTSEKTTKPGIREKKILGYDTVMGTSTNTHTIRMWIDESVKKEEQNKSFLSKIEVNAGQGYKKYYTEESCFTITEAGVIKAYDVNCGGTDVVIPYEINGITVKEINSLAFSTKGLTSIELPRSVTRLSTGAFMGNLTLEKIVLKDGLTHITSSVFANTTYKTSSLKFIAIPETVISIGQDAFSNNEIEQVVLPDSVTSIGTLAFGDNAIKHLKIGSGLTTIANNAFRNNKIEKLEIPDNITTIGSNAFASNSLTEVHLGKGLTTIQTKAFYMNPTLKFLEIPRNVVSIAEDGISLSEGSIIIVKKLKREANFSEGWGGYAQIFYE